MFGCLTRWFNMNHEWWSLACDGISNLFTGWLKSDSLLSHHHHHIVSLTVNTVLFTRIHTDTTVHICLEVMSNHSVLLEQSLNLWHILARQWLFKVSFRKGNELFEKLICDKYTFKKNGVYSFIKQRVIVCSISSDLCWSLPRHCGDMTIARAC